MRHPNPKILAVLAALAAATFAAYLAAPDRDEPARWVERTFSEAYPIEMDVVVPERVAAVLREHPIPGVRVAAVTPDLPPSNP